MAGRLAVFALLSAVSLARQPTFKEVELLELINDQRSKGTECRNKGYFAPVPPLKFDCHMNMAALWRAENASQKTWEELNSDNGDDGNGPYELTLKAGGKFNGGEITEKTCIKGLAGEHAETAFNSYNYGSCDLLMDPDFTHIGIGYVSTPMPGSDSNLPHHYWKSIFSYGNQNPDDCPPDTIRIAIRSETSRVAEVSPPTLRTSTVAGGAAGFAALVAVFVVVGRFCGSRKDVVGGEVEELA